MGDAAKIFEEFYNVYVMEEWKGPYWMYVFRYCYSCVALRYAMEVDVGLEVDLSPDTVLDF